MRHLRVRCLLSQSEIGQQVLAAALSYQAHVVAVRLPFLHGLEGCWNSLGDELVYDWRIVLFAEVPIEPNHLLVQLRN